MDTPPPEKHDRFKTYAAILLALVTVMGAVVAWRAATAADAAGNADADGMAATLNAEETRAINSVNTFEHYRAYTAYLRHNELGNRIAKDLPDAPGDSVTSLRQQKTDAWDLAVEIQGFFPARYLDPEGNYDTAREIDESWADAEQQKDLHPESHFSDADRFRVKSNSLVILWIPLAGALWCFTVSESMKHALKYVLAIAGTLLLIGCIAGVLMLEFAA